MTNEPAGHVLGLVAAGILLLSLPFAAQDTPRTPSQLSPPFRVGEPFPALQLPSMADGKPASIADFRGQRLILHIFASW